MEICHIKSCLAFARAHCKVMGSNPVNCQRVLVLLQNLHIEHVFMWEIRIKFSYKFLTNNSNQILVTFALNHHSSALAIFVIRKKVFSWIKVALLAYSNGSLSRKFYINGPQLIYLSQLEHKTEDFAKINPFQTVPVIEHNGHNIIESVAILRYLTSTHKVDDHWYPNEPLAQARVDEYLSWQHANTRSALTL